MVAEPWFPCGRHMSGGYQFCNRHHQSILLYATHYYALEVLCAAASSYLSNTRMIKLQGWGRN
jgi:hypothetical protein